MFEILLNHFKESITATLSIVESSIDQGMVGMHMPGQAPQGEETREDPALAGTGQGRRQPPPGKVRRQNFAKPLPKTRRPAFDPENPDTWGKVQRNAPCPCGSGKKYKACHGKITGAAQQ